MRHLVYASALPLLLACDLEMPERREALELSAADVARLTIVAGAGDLTLTADPGATEISVVAGLRGERTEIAVRRVGATLELGERCPAGACAIDWHVTLPAGLALELDTGAGDIRVDGPAADIRAVTGAGDITLAGVRATSVDVESGAGDVTAEDVACALFRGETGLGDLDLALSARPRDVAWSSGAGDVAVALPAGAYALDLDTGLGDIDVAGVRRDADAPALTLHTGFGDIDVAGRGP